LIPLSPLWVVCGQAQILELHVAPLQRVVEELVEQLQGAHQVDQDFGLQVQVVGLHAEGDQVLGPVRVSTDAQHLKMANLKINLKLI
jgi:hypothetical protein